MNQAESNYPPKEEEKQRLHLEIAHLKSKLMSLEAHSEALQSTNAQLSTSNIKLQADLTTLSLKLSHEISQAMASLEYTQLGKQSALEEKERLSEEVSVLALKLEQLKQKSEEQSNLSEYHLQLEKRKNQKISDELTALRDSNASLYRETAETTAKNELYIAGLKGSYEKYISQLSQTMDVKDTAYRKQALEFNQQFDNMHHSKKLIAEELNAKQQELDLKTNEVHLLNKLLEEAQQRIWKLEEFEGLADTLAETVKDLETINTLQEAHLAELERSMENGKTQNSDLENKVHSLRTELLASKQEIDKLENSLKPVVAYIPLKSDPVDCALAEYLVKKPSKVPFARESQGQYEFGLRRVFAKIENGVLVIRVGGGYMLIEDFIELYSPVEMERLAYNGIRSKQQDTAARKSPSKVLAKDIIDSLRDGNFNTMFTPKTGSFSDRRTGRRSTAIK